MESVSIGLNAFGLECVCLYRRECVLIGCSVFGLDGVCLEWMECVWIRGSATR